MSDAVRTDVRAGDDAHCRALLRQHDRDRFLASLFAPASSRPHLIAVYAFAIELAAIPARVSEQALGEIRLQWWRETLQGVAAGARSAHPVADALARAIGAAGLPLETLEAMIVAREDELSGADVQSLVALEDNLAAIEAGQMMLAARILGADGISPETMRHAGIALGLTRALAVPERAMRLPRDLMAVHGATGDAGGGCRPGEGPRLTGVMADLVATASHHLQRARAGLARPAPSALPAFLPLACVGHDLRRLRRSPGAGAAGLLRHQIAIYMAARRGRI